MNETTAATLPVDESLRRSFLEPEIGDKGSASSASYAAPESTQSFKSMDASDSDWASEIALGPGIVAGICAGVLVIVLLLLGLLWKCWYDFAQDAKFSYHGTNNKVGLPRRQANVFLYARRRTLLFYHISQVKIHPRPAFKNIPIVILICRQTGTEARGDCIVQISLCFWAGFGTWFLPLFHFVL